MSDADGRLNGWKDIAAFLDRSVRTVQRWEGAYGLPAHRQGPEGELIFAYRDELDAWVRAGGSRGRLPDAPDEPGDVAAPRELRADGPAVAHDARLPDPVRAEAEAAIAGDRPRPPAFFLQPIWWIASLGAVSGLIALAVLAREWTQRAVEVAPGVPSAWRAVGEALQIVDESGRLLWSRAYDVNFEKLASGLGGEPGEEPVVIRDIDGDGLPEVVVSPPQPLLWADKAVSVFNADGSLRFRVDPRQTVRFGDRSFAGPWVPYRTFPLPGTPGVPPQLWLVFIHGMWFPSFAVHLSPAGEPLDTYWSDGYIELVQAMRWRGQDGVVFAGTNNETRSASLAFLIASSAHGAAPSASPDYRCSGCPEGEPAEFLLFPRRCLALALNGHPTIRT